jgi:high-affinity nickel-transport protein
MAADGNFGVCAMTGIALDVLSFLFLGFFLGMRHATDADHVVAIATIVSRERSVAGSALIGAAWGVGHTITVMAVGAAIIVFGVVIPPRLGLSMEFAVGVMLVVLGVLTLTGMGRAAGTAHRHAGGGAGRAPDLHNHLHSHLHDHLHAHGDYVHRHPHGHQPGEHGHAEEHTPLARLDRSSLGRVALYQWLRPFVVGLVHGLAGSAAIALMVLSVIREPLAAVGYLLLFGLGTIVGMMLITLILSAPFAFTAVNLPKFNWRLRVASGLLSFVFGVVLIYGIGFAEGGLFTDTPAWQPS